LAGAFLFYEKIRKSAALFWFGLPDVGILQLFCSRGVLQRRIVNNLHIFVGGKDCGLCPYNPSAEEVGGLYGFLYEALKSFQIFEIKIRN
jgi:hypothetical protein